MTLTPKNGHIFVEAILPEQYQSISGLLIPTDSATGDEQLAQGSVLFSASAEYKEGDIVLFNKLIPNNIQLEQDGKKKELFGLHESDIMAILKK